MGDFAGSLRELSDCVHTPYSFSEYGHSKYNGRRVNVKHILLLLTDKMQTTIEHFLQGDLARLYSFVVS